MFKNLPIVKTTLMSFRRVPKILRPLKLRVELKHIVNWRSKIWFWEALWAQLDPIKVISARKPWKLRGEPGIMMMIFMINMILNQNIGSKHLNRWNVVRVCWFLNSHFSMKGEITLFGHWFPRYVKWWIESVCLYKESKIYYSDLVRKKHDNVNQETLQICEWKLVLI